MRITRRNFMRSAIAMGATSCLPKVKAENPLESKSILSRRILGKTKESVTLLGLGCAYAGGALTEGQTRATIVTALEGGIRYFDAAPEYDRAEKRLGPVIKGIRGEVFLVTKSYALDAKTAEKDLAQALKQLQVDHVDLFLQHGVGLKPKETNQQILAKGGSLEYLMKAKERGLTRFIGMSVHPPFETAMELLNASTEWEVVMPFLNYITMAQERLAAKSNGKKEGENAYEKLLRQVHKDGLGLVAMKVLGGSPGKLADEYDRAFRFSLSVPGVSCALIGTRTPDQVKRAIRAARNFRPMTEFEMEDTLYMGEEAVRRKSIKVGILEQHQKRDFGSPWTRGSLNSPLLS